MDHDEISYSVLSAPPSRCLIGFDGFTDDIYRVVDQRRLEGPQFIPKIPQLASRISAAAGKSTNLELVRQCRKVGGNGPILAQALVEARHQVVLAGTVGEGEVEPLFLPLTQRCTEVLALGASGQSDALEFEDGKIILGKLAGLQNIDASCLQPIAPWVTRIESCRLMAAVNWTMLPGMTSIWRLLADEIGPLLPGRRWLFIDLADPAKRTDEDLMEGLTLLGLLQRHFDVVLGLNLAEAERVMQVLGLTGAAESRAELEGAAVRIREKLTVEQVIIHPTGCAVAASQRGVWSVKGKVVDKPKLTTGGGDNFNAGYCHGLLAGLEPREALFCGVSWSGYYVRHGMSPTREQVIAYFDDLVLGSK